MEICTLFGFLKHVAQTFYQMFQKSIPFCRSKKKENQIYEILTILSDNAQQKLRLYNQFYFFGYYNIFLVSQVSFSEIQSNINNAGELTGSVLFKKFSINLYEK